MLVYASTFSTTVLEKQKQQQLCMLTAGPASCTCKPRLNVS